MMCLFCWPKTPVLRSEVLGVPLTGEDGSRLKYVSPRQVRLSQKFAKVLGDIEKVLDEAQQKKRKPVLSPLQDSARRLDEALELFLQLGYDPNRAGKANPWVASDFAGMQKSWVRCAQALSQHPPLTVQAENLRVPEDNQQSAQQLRRKLDGCLRAAMLERQFYQLADKTDTAMQDFITQWGPVENGRKPVSSVESAAAKVRRLTADLDAKMRELAGQDLPDPALLVEDNREDVRGYRQIFSRWTRDLALQTAQLPWGLYAAEARLFPSFRPSSRRPWRPIAIAAKSIPGSACNLCSRGRPACCKAIPPTTFARSARHGTMHGPPGSTATPAAVRHASPRQWSSSRPPCGAWRRRSSPTG